MTEKVKEVIEKVEESAALKAVDVLDKNIDKVANAITDMGSKISEFVLTNGDNALDLLLLGARIDAFSEFADGFVWVGFSLVLYTFYRYMIKGIKFRVIQREEHNESKSGTEDLESWLSVWPALHGFIQAVILAIGTFQFLNYWAIAGVIKPELWVAKKILEQTGVF